MCHRYALALSLPGFVCLSVLSVTPHFFEFPYEIFVESYLRGRHLLQSLCTLKTGTMKARVEVRHDLLQLRMQCTTRCTVLLSIDTLIPCYSTVQCDVVQCNCLDHSLHVSDSLVSHFHYSMHFSSIMLSVPHVQKETNVNCIPMTLNAFLLNVRTRYVGRYSPSPTRYRKYFV